MRPDMGKCVLEEPRRGHASKGFKSRNFGKMVDRGDGLEYEGPLRIWNSMNYGQRTVRGPKASWDDKCFSDSLGPINGYLFSRVGQPWDKVYSEIRQNLGKGGWPLRHIVHAHIDVELHCYEDDDGNIHHNTSKWHWRNRGSVSGFYVHPRTKLLCYEPEGDWRSRGRGPGLKPSWKLKKPAPIEEIRNGPDGWTYLKIGELWFKGVYAKAEYEVWNKYFKRMDTVSHDVFTRKRSCSRKDLKWIRSQIGI